jgi:hypothetical protein
MDDILAYGDDDDSDTEKKKKVNNLKKKKKQASPLPVPSFFAEEREENCTDLEKIRRVYFF